MLSRGIYCASLLVVALSAEHLWAQSEPVRIQLASLSDSLQHVSDTSSIRALASRPAGESDAWAGVQRLRFGLLTLRLGQLAGDRGPLDRAQALFDDAARAAPTNWPWPWFGLAQADLALDSIGAVVKPSSHLQAGVHYKDAALAALGRSLNADSAFAPASQAVATLVLPFGERHVDQDLEASVRRAASTGQLPSAWLVLGRILRAREQPDSALAAFERFATLGGGSSVAMLEESRSLYSLGRMAEAQAVYLDGAAIGSEEGRAEYRRDIAWVASPAELATFDSLSASQVGLFVAHFWARRDAEDLLPPGGRLAEHVRRWHYVFKHFQLSARARGPVQRSGASCGPAMFASHRDDPMRTAEASAILNMVSPELQLATPGILAATRRGRRLVDDRGLIYMRHGEPDLRISAIAEPTHPVVERSDPRYTSSPVEAETGPNESWKYDGPDGSLVFHFCGSMALGTQAPTTLVAMLPLTPEMMGARSALDARYDALEAQLMLWRAGSPGFSSSYTRRLATSLAESGKQSIELGLRTDAFSPEFKHHVQPYTQFFAVGDSSDNTGAMIAVFAIRTSDLHAIPADDGGLVYPVALRLVATDADGRLARLDTTRYFHAWSPLPDDRYLYGMQSMALAPGRWDLRLIVLLPGVSAGGAVERRAVQVPQGSALELSDLIFGLDGSGLTWEGPDGAVPLKPLDVYSRQGAVDVYYELYGVVAGHEYDTVIELAGESKGSKGKARLEFTEPASGSPQYIRRRVGLNHLKGGRYRMTVTVRDALSGQQTTRSRSLNVVK